MPDTSKETVRGNYKGILFMADVVDYTTQSRELGSDITEQFNRHYETTVRQLCKEHQGQFIKRQGDGVLIFFADEEHFIRFAQKLREKSREKALDCGDFFGDVRMVAHYGNFSFQTLRDDIIDLIGPEGIKVFRIETYANKHELLVTDFLLNMIKNILIREGMRDKALERVHLKGFDQSHLLYKIIFPEEEQPVRSGLLYKRMAELEANTKVIPVFGDLYPAMSMQDNFINLDVRQNRSGDHDGDPMMEMRLGKREKGGKRATVDVKTLYETIRGGIILGLPGSGKTTILKYLAYREFKKKQERDTPPEERDRLVFFIPCAGVPGFKKWFRLRYPGGKDGTEAVKPGFTLANVLAYIAGCFLVTGTGASPKWSSREVKSAERSAYKFFMDGRLTVLIDALDEAPDKEVKRDLAAVAETLLTERKKVRGGNRVFLTGRFSERDRFVPGPGPGRHSAKPLPVMEVRPLDMEQMRDMARYFYGEESALYKKFDQVVWQEEIATKVGGTPLTALLVIAYFEIHQEFDTRFKMYDIIVIFILVRAWKQMKEREFTKDLGEFFRDAGSETILNEEKNAARMYDAITLLSYEHMDVGREIRQEVILDIFSRFAVHVQREPGVTVKAEAQQWLEQMKEDHLLVPAGAVSYVFIHSTVMEYLAARFIHRKIENPVYLDHIFRLPPILEHLEEKKAGFLETEILPIAVGSCLETGALLMLLLLEWKDAAKSDAERETIYWLGLRCLAEYESYVDRQYKIKPLPILHRDMEEFFDDNFEAVDWVYRFLARVVLSDNPGQLEKALEWSIPIARLSLPVFLNGYVTDIKTFLRGYEETASLRAQIIDQLVNRERVTEWLTKHRSAVKNAPSVVADISGTGDLLHFDASGYHPDDKHFRYYASYSGPELTGFLGSPNLKHSGGVRCVAVSHDGQFIASGSDDCMAKLWDIKSGKEIRTFKGHTGSVNSIAFSNDDLRIISGSSDNTIKCWNTRMGNEIRTLKGHTQGVTSVAFIIDDTIIISGSLDKTVKCWYAHSGKEMRTFKEHSREVTSVCFSKPSMIVSGSRSNNIKYWDINLPYKDSMAKNYDFNPDREVWELKGHKKAVTCIVDYPRDRVIISGSLDRTVRCWDLNSGSLVEEYKGHLAGVTCVTFDRYEGIIISGSIDKTIKCWDTQKEYLEITYTGHLQAVTSVAFSHENTLIISGSLDHTIKCWDNRLGTEPNTFIGHSSAVLGIAFNNDGMRIISGSSDNTIRCWNIKSGKEMFLIEGHKDAVTSVAISSDNSRLISGSLDNTIKCWDTASGKEMQTFKGHTGPVYSVAFSGGELIISGSSDGTIKSWDARSGKEVRTFKGHLNEVNSIAFSSNDALIISGSSDNTIKCWDTNWGGKEIRTFKGHKDTVSCVDFSSDDALIVSGSDDNTIKCWTTNSGKEVQTFKGHDRRVTGVAFTGNDKHILSTSADHTLKIWEIKTGTCIKTIPLLWTPEQIKLHPTQPTIAATANLNGTVTFFDLSEWI